MERKVGQRGAESYVQPQPVKDMQSAASAAALPKPDATDTFESTHIAQTEDKPFVFGTGTSIEALEAAMSRLGADTEARSQLKSLLTSQGWEPAALAERSTSDLNLLQRLVDRLTEQHARSSLNPMALFSKARAASTGNAAPLESVLESTTKSIRDAHQIKSNAAEQFKYELNRTNQKPDISRLTQLAQLVDERNKPALQSAIDKSILRHMDASPETAASLLLGMPTLAPFTARRRQELLQRALIELAGAPGASQESIKAILAEPGADPNVAQNALGSPLERAIEAGSVDTLRTLLAHPKADPNRSTSTGSLVGTAIMNGKLEHLAQLLSDDRTDPNLEFGRGTLPLEAAISNSNLEATRMLLANPKVNPSPEVLHFLMMTAATENKYEILRTLVQDSRIGPKDTDVLFNLIRRNQLPTVQDLLGKFELNHRNSRGETLLSAAVNQNDSRAVDALLADDRVDPTVATNGRIPLEAAIGNKNLDMIRALLAHPKSATVTGLDIGGSRYVPYLGSLTQLESLGLANNGLTSLPGWIPEKLKGLQRLGLEGNTLKTLPASIGNLTHLKSLNLRGNPLAARGSDSGSWGKEELRRHFGDRVLLDD